MRGSLSSTRRRRSSLLHPAALPRLRIHHCFLAGLRLGATIAMFLPDTALVLAAQRRLLCTFFSQNRPCTSARSRRRRARTRTRPRSTSRLRASRRCWPTSGSRPPAASTDRRLRHDGASCNHPKITARLLASTRGARRPSLQVHRRSGKPLPRSCRWRGRRAHRPRPADVLRLLNQDDETASVFYRGWMAAHGRPRSGARRLHLRGGLPQEMINLRLQRLPHAGGKRRAFDAGSSRRRRVGVRWPVSPVRPGSARKRRNFGRFPSHGRRCTINTKSS